MSEIFIFRKVQIFLYTLAHTYLVLVCFTIISNQDTEEFGFMDNFEIFFESIHSQVGRKIIASLRFDTSSSSVLYPGASLCTVPCFSVRGTASSDGAGTRHLFQLKAATYLDYQHTPNIGSLVFVWQV